MLETAFWFTQLSVISSFWFKSLTDLLRPEARTEKNQRNVRFVKGSFRTHGRQQRLNCSVVGEPKPTYSWLHNGRVRQKMLFRQTDQNSSNFPCFNEAHQNV